MFRAIRIPFKGMFSLSLVLLAALSCLHSAGALQADAPKPSEPTDEKARKTYENAREWEKQRKYGAAMDDFRKANKQDGNHCRKCLREAYLMAMQIKAYKDAEDIARDLLAESETDGQKAGAHYRLAIALQKQGLDNKKEKCFSDSCDEFKTALDIQPKLTTAHYAFGVSLAHLHQDDAAKREFAAYLADDKTTPDMHDRVERYMDHIELARATMAPPFSLVTMDGQRVTMDGLAGKVVLIDFWATWCGPCREALPHIRKIAEKFAGPQFVVLSVSLDTEEGKWRDFVGKNGMTWMQYRDGGFNGQIAKLFDVRAIPATFTIDADGVLEDQHVGDANIEGKLKKLITQAAEVANRKPLPPVSETAPGSVD